MCSQLVSYFASYRNVWQVQLNVCGFNYVVASTSLPPSLSSSSSAFCNLFRGHSQPHNCLARRVDSFHSIVFISAATNLRDWPQKERRRERGKEGEYQKTDTAKSSNLRVSWQILNRFGSVTIKTSLPLSFSFPHSLPFLRCNCFQHQQQAANWICLRYHFAVPLPLLSICSAGHANKANSKKHRTVVRNLWFHFHLDQLLKWVSIRFIYSTFQLVNVCLIYLQFVPTVLGAKRKLQTNKQKAKSNLHATKNINTMQM